ncbi:hypothetical protein BBJ28_00013576 [Nothophytophthora sp. Chile5]|nr:hypothetical protein BBJ28_00013576 [Nothophytophthora sp. Chile5]
MWRYGDQERSVLMLDAPKATDDAVYASSDYDQPAPRHQAESDQDTTAASSARASSEPKAARTPPDVILHAGDCEFALHLSVLTLRCPWLHKQLLQLRNPRSSSPRQQMRRLQLAEQSEKTPGFALQLIDLDEGSEAGVGRDTLASTASQPESETPRCPLKRDAFPTAMTYVRCIAERHQSHQMNSQDGSSARQGGHSGEENDAARDRPIIQRRKRLRRDLRAAGGTKNLTKSRRARSLFSTDTSSMSESFNRRGVLHVELLGADVSAVATVVEYLYTFKVRLLDEKTAQQTAKLAQWLEMRSTLQYYCLSVACQHVTTASWMELLLTASTLDAEPMRRALCSQLTDFLRSLQPQQYYEMLKDVSTGYLAFVKHHDMLVRVVVGLINHVRLLEFWQNVLNGLSKWLIHRFASPQVPSLDAMHHTYAPNWEPYVEKDFGEISTNPGRAQLFTLLEFGDFQLQVRIDILESMPILWRVIKRTSPKVLLPERDELESSAALAGDPEFWIHGQMKVKYWRAHKGGTKVKAEVVVGYHHCRNQYSRWHSLVPSSPSTTAPTKRMPAYSPEGMGRVQFRGKFFLWGDPVCSLYHHLLQTTLFYCAPFGASSELADLMIVSEMQRLPVGTLVLVLRSDRLRVPDGERTLLRCLNKMVFGNSFNQLQAAAQVPHGYNGSADDVISLYKCVRWCFVPIEDIIATLRRSPRQLKLYELIEDGLGDTFRRFYRRRPWGWHKARHAYIKNETNMVEFRIEANEEGLSPEHFPSDLDESPPTKVISPPTISLTPPCSLRVP